MLTSAYMIGRLVDAIYEGNIKPEEAKLCINYVLQETSKPPQIVMALPMQLGDERDELPDGEIDWENPPGLN